MKTLLQTTALTAGLVGALVAASPMAHDDAFHFALDRSAPEADATVEAPSEIRLWFTEEPQEGTTSIRVVEAEDAGVHVTEVVQDEEDATSFYVQLHGALPAGTYTVSWRGMGDDGHVVRDSYQFSVAAH
jgi:copper transport protein